MTEMFNLSMVHKKALYVCLLILTTALIYTPVVNNGFTNWDDDLYITNNKLVGNLSLNGLEKIWKTGSVVGNYHPLTMTIIAVEYRFFKTTPAPYHAVSMILHILNTLLVFWLVLLLLKQPEIALMAALLFGVHPLHVESVAWAAELKDLLYGLFYLSGLISYIYYLNKSRRLSLYYLSLILFVCSLLSKSMAVMFPVHLLLFDYLQGRKMDGSAIFDKIPFLGLSICFGIIALFSQHAGGAMSQHVGWVNSVMVAARGLLFYPVKFIAPVKLSALYPYPTYHQGFYPWSYIAAPFLVLSLSWVLLINRKRWPLVFWTFVFYIITILPVLQLLPVGYAVAADRYGYIASISFCILAGYGVNWLWVKTASRRFIQPTIVGVFIFILAFYGLLARQRISIWHDSLTLWNDAITKYPESAVAYNNRGSALHGLGYFGEAERDYNKAIGLDSTYEFIYRNRGRLRLMLDKYDLAIADYQRVLKLDSRSSIAYNNLGYIYLNSRKYGEALDVLNKAVAIDPEFADAIYNRSFVYGKLGNKSGMLEDLNRVISLDYGYQIAYLDRGRYYLSVFAPQKALEDFTQAIRYRSDDNAAYLGRGRAYGMLGMLNEATADLMRAVLLVPNDPESRFYLAKCYYAMGNIKSARQNAEIAESLGYAVSPQFKQQLSLRSH